MNERWQFWIDVGGTFTDCVACAPDGRISTHKTLSSGRVKGRIDAIRDDAIFDSLRIGDPPNFWQGWEIRISGADGEGPFRSQVVSSDSQSGILRLKDPRLPSRQQGDRYELAATIDAPVLCIRYLLGLRPDEMIPTVDVRFGTTRGTNALLERQGAKTAFITTRGFGDLLMIGNQDRPELFNLNIQKPKPLYSTVVEVEERIAANGNVIESLDPDVVERQLLELRSHGIESIAIAFLHAYRNDAHERLVDELARKVGFEEVSRSSDVAPSIKIVPRAETTVLDGYLNPVLRQYIQRIHRSLSSGSTLRVMTSSGGLIDATRFTGKDSLLSGPAGGVVAFSRIGEQAGFAKSIGFDMGGTSTDVSRYGGQLELQSETMKAGVRIASPTLAIETVAAGGGSICSFDGIQLRVGPQSAGANPGPACYGRGGPLTVTDVNVALGRVISDQFPFPLDRQAVERRLNDLCEQIAAASGQHYSPIELAQGFVDIANETMARAIRKVSIQKGYDPQDHLLISFGGAGGQHACAMARSLGIKAILIHPFAGILSAYGMGLADVRRRDERPILQRLTDELLETLEPQFAEMESQLRQQVVDEGVHEEQINCPIRSISMRYSGLETTLHIEINNHSKPDEVAPRFATAQRPGRLQLRAEYESEFERQFGYRHTNRGIEVVAAIVEVVGRTSQLANRETQAGQTKPNCETTVWHQNEELSTPVYLRKDLRSSHVITGPAMICDNGSTIWVEPGFSCEIKSDGTLLLTMSEQGINTTAITSTVVTEPDLIQLEVFNNQFASIAEQMGFTLQRTSVSTNVKERLDYSCAIFDATGGLVVNAPHIPVHLGAMGETVRHLLNNVPLLHPGDVYVTNDPYAGGSHLPDVTVITPVHAAETGELLFLTASRAHHAEIGGITPGSMPPFSKYLAEEGVLIRQFQLVDRGQSREQELESLLASGEFPTRNVADNLADIAAQVAANRLGANLLLSMTNDHGQSVVLSYMQHVQTTARRKMERALERIPNGVYPFRDHLDDGSPICVEITMHDRSATIDFSGTGPVLSTNLNANRAIVTAACMYVFRCLIEDSIPLNSGVLEPLEIVLPECLLNPPGHSDPARCAAMVGGNVETSQRVVDVLLGALGVAAASQGTMNNLTFGDNNFGYYETICGGSGATATQSGADAVHTHMTNTRLTDIEVIEHRYPVRINQFSIRTNSGGAGQYRGGDGISRTFEFLRPLKVSLLTQRRGEYSPFGLNGGTNGSIGRNTLRRKGDRTAADVGGCVLLDVNSGDQLTIETPGGGGFGSA